MATTTHLPPLESDYPLQQPAIDDYRRDGHVLLPALCSPEEIAAYQPPFSEEVNRRSTHRLAMEQRDTYGKAFLQVMNLWRDDSRFKQFVFAQRFAKVAAALLGVNAVRLYHDQALFKEGGGGKTPWHQDQHYWPLATDNTVTLWMPLVDISEAMGTMTFASKSQHTGYLGDLPISDESHEQLHDFVKEKGFTPHNHGAMTAGDATFHSGWVLHSAPGNDSDRTREVMTIIYYPDGTLVGEADNANRKNDLETWIPGGIPGQPAASELNPILHPAR